MPRLPTPGAHDVAAERGHHRALLLHGAAGDEGLRLGDVGFGHDGPGGRVVEFGEDRDHLTWTEGRRREDQSHAHFTLLGFTAQTVER